MLSQTKNQSCETKQQVECINEFANISILDNYKFCFPFCPLQCNKTEYRTTLASVKLYGESFVDYINDNPNLRSDFPSTQIIDASQARESFIRLNIYYDSLSYTYSSETSKMDIVSLISFIGGTLSLFLGVNMFSISELIEVLIELILIKKNTLYSYKT